MQGWRRRVFFVLLAYSAAMLIWSVRPWTDTHAEVTPPEADPVFAVYKCPSIFNARPENSQPEEELVYPLNGRACDQQETRRALAVIDAFVVVAGLILIVRSGVRHQAALDEENPTVVEVPAL